MKRKLGKSKRRSRDSRDSRFLFVNLEARQLLAGDVSAPELNFKFIGPVIEVTATIKSASAEQATKSECENVTDDQSEEQTKVCIADDDTPTIIQFDAVDLYWGIDGDEVTFSQSDSGNPGERYNYYDGRFTGYEYDQSADPAKMPEEPAPISLIIREPVSDSMPSDKAQELTPMKGIYFNEPAKASQALSATELEIDSSARSGLLAQNQMFAVISPSEIASRNAATFSATAVAASSTTKNSPASAEQIAQIDSATSTTTPSPTFSKSFVAPSQQRVPAASVESFKFRLSSERGTGVTSPRTVAQLALKQATPNQFSIQSNISRALIDRLSGFKNSGSKSEPEAQVRPAEIDTDDNNDVRDKAFARRIQVFESAVTLVGLPTSRIWRNDDESTVRSPV
ncbi:hypothetical protein [Mariniblastus fucicola]|uniref:Uncharacterized protein n=1 Tax=Mariniblastus fucicola TaxID=980251 RepID=A0A5B9P8B3_9BACT|nr:hypothetical protein [Mariniblastus fucicola]QEG21455.1 hypothetical protein MFFC18_13110 [Mariniblastus fucicola]